MALNLSQFDMIGGVRAHNSSSMAAPVVRRAVNCSRKSNSSSFFMRSDLSCRSSSSSSVDKINLELEQDYIGTPYVPVYVMLPDGIIDPDWGLRLHNPTDLREELSRLKSMNVDGVKVECWWGIVEPQVPKYYDWSDYKELFQIVRDLKLKLQVVLCFHASLHIPLPRWVMYVGKKNPDIFFTDSNGRRNHDCLSWGIDDQPVLMNRTASQVYHDFMISFREELKEFIVDGSFISNIEIGLGPCGELRIPSRSIDNKSRGNPGDLPLPVKKFQGEFPPIEEFQFYDKYMMKSLKEAWEERGDLLCGVRRRPSTGSCSNSSPHKTNYFSYQGYTISLYGRFFLKWYSGVLVDHADKMLSLGKDAFSDYCSISAKIPEICHLWHEPNIDVGKSYKYAKSSCDAPIISVLKKYKTSLNSTVPEMRAIGRVGDFPDALADEIGMDWQLLYAAGAAGIPVSAENDRCFSDRRGYQEILEIVKPTNDPIGRHVSSFTYLRLGYKLHNNLKEFERFVQMMHGIGLANPYPPLDSPSH